MKTNQNLTSLIQESVKNSLSGHLPKNSPKPEQKPGVSVVNEAKTQQKTKVSSLLKEAMVMVPKTFLLKTDFLSSKAKEAHEKLYKGYVDTLNKVSSLLMAANPEEANSMNSAFRSLKMDESYNLNASKLHELYFSNISDQASNIAIDSLPYMRFARDFGTFDRWQFDFRACALAAREGWVVCYFEPVKNCYINTVVDGHNVGIPLGGVPVLVIDMWAHAYYRDYLDDKKSYVNAMMREINWNVVEARMMVAEKSNVGDVWRIQPVQNSAPERIMTTLAADAAPIDRTMVKTQEVMETPPPDVGNQGTPRQ